MNPEKIRSSIKDVVQKDSSFCRIISHLTDVLRIYMFIVDEQGRVIWQPDKRRYGASFLFDNDFGSTLQAEDQSFLSFFHKRGNYYECMNTFAFHYFAVPIYAELNPPLGYTVIGPVILNKHLSHDEYSHLLAEKGLQESQFKSVLNEIRVASNIMTNSILDLINELTENNIRNKFSGLEVEQEAAVQPCDISETLLENILAVALKMTRTECGSIMILDPEKNELVVKASKGIDPHKLASSTIKWGEGISGLAAKEKVSLVISKDQIDERIAHLLKRPDIKKALVMPLYVQDKVMGVLNLHSKRSHNVLRKKSLDFLPYLSEFLIPMFSQS